MWCRCAAIYHAKKSGHQAATSNTYSFRDSADRLFVTPYLDPAPTDVRTAYLPGMSLLPITEKRSMTRGRVSYAESRLTTRLSVAVIMDTDFRLCEAFS